MKKVNVIIEEFKQLFNIDEVYLRRFILLGHKNRMIILKEIDKYHLIYKEIDINILLRALIVKYINIKFNDRIYI